MMKTKKMFRRFSSRVSYILGSPYAFFLAVVLIIGWLVSGPFFDFSDTWQLVINTVTTIATFLTVFSIQNTQNRDTRSIQIKLDELIKSNKGARNKIIGVEDLEDEEIEALYRKLKERKGKRH